ncbi:MAG TPA: hypothetical protein VJP84_12005 [Steroidobacteraceae bacterium]|jgi:hypothetical protein|nr:hypothetical protein [Steroidobacteraceae bacterium]
MNEKADEDRVSKLLDNFFDELQAMPDRDVLAGESPQAVRARAADRLARATQEAGRRRLAAARIQAVHVNRAPVKPVSVQEARDYIARVIEDRHYTLAARQLEEMPESEILRLYEQLRELEDDAGPAR